MCMALCWYFCTLDVKRLCDSGEYCRTGEKEVIPARPMIASFRYPTYRKRIDGQYTTVVDSLSKR